MYTGVIIIIQFKFSYAYSGRCVKGDAIKRCGIDTRPMLNRLQVDVAPYRWPFLIGKLY